MVSIINTVSVILAVCSTVFVLTSGYEEIEENDASSYLFSNTTRHFSFNDCGRNNSVFKFQHLAILPDPVVLKRTSSALLYLNITYDVTESLYSNISYEADLSIQLKIPGGYKDVCELLGEPLCHYNDIAGMLNEHGIHANVSHYISKGHHAVENPLPLPSIPFTLKGTFDVTIYVKQQGRQLGCLSLHFCITECLFES